MKYFLCVIASGLLACIWDASAVLAMDPKNSHTQKHGNAEAVVIGENPDADGVETSLSGTITVILRVEGKGGLKVDPVAAIVASQEWKERRRDAESVASQGADALVWQQKFYLEPSSPKVLKIDLVPLRYRENSDDAWTTVPWDSVSVKVTTEITDADVKQLRDITPPESVSVTEQDYHWLLWSGVVVLSVALAIAAYAVSRRLRPSRPPVPADQRALQELDAIQKMNLPAVGDGIRHHALVAEAARRYFEQRFQLRVAGKTTAELMDAIQLDGHLRPEQFAILRGALERFDLAKFARVSPTEVECVELSRQIRTLVEQTARAETT
jgi:hypothetical protein